MKLARWITYQPRVSDWDECEGGGDEASEKEAAV